MYEILTTCGKARRARLETPHGVIETPVFMNVGTAAAIRGGASTDDLREIKTLVELSNTYHLHMQPGEDLIARLGGLHNIKTDRNLLLAKPSSATKSKYCPISTMAAKIKT